MASSSSAATWQPPTQRIQAKVGKVLNKALKARKLKGEPAPPPTTAKRIPDFHYHSFLFKHKPISIDQTRPATLEVRKAPDNVVFAKAEFPSVNPGDAYAMVGEEIPAKEVDCLLIYDEDANTWTLEKLDSFVRFQAVTKVEATPPQPASPAPTAGIPALKKAKPSEDKDDDLERQLLDLAGSSVPEDKNRKPPPPSTPAPAIPNKRHADSDDEEGEVEVPLRLLHQPAKDVRNIKPIPKVSPKAKISAPSPKPMLPKPATSAPTTHPSSTPSNIFKSTKPTAKSTVAPSAASLPLKPTPSTLPPAEALPQPLKSKKARPVPSAARPPPIEDGPSAPQPLKPAKRQRVTAPPPKPTPPPPPKPLNLSLPGGSGTFAPPPLPPSLAKPVPAPVKVAPQPPPPDPKDPASMIVDSEEEEEDEWETVAEVAPEPTHEPARIPHSFNIVMEEENDYIIPDARGTSMDDDVDPDLAAALDEELFSMDTAGDGNDMDYGSDADGDGEEPEDFLALAMSNEPGLPMSLNRYAEQNSVGDDSDVTSSSSEEDSDDE